MESARYALWLGLLAVLSVLGVAFVSFLLFLKTLTLHEPDDPLPAQGIVVLTGGADRLADGLRLLESGRGQRLLVSGVHRKTDLAELRRFMPERAAQLACCVDLDHAADNTRGNAREAARWALQHGYTSLIVVTASYHVPRTRLEFEHRMPRASLAFYPVVPDVVGLKNPWRDAHLMRILLLEYAKYRLAQVRITLGLAGTAEPGP